MAAMNEVCVCVSLSLGPFLACFLNSSSFSKKKNCWVVFSSLVFSCAGKLGS
jgi:hypothetical protein